MTDPHTNPSSLSNNSKSNVDSNNAELITTKPSDASKEFMLVEYGRINEYFAENERDGNTRINLFITLTTTLMSAFGITKQFEDNEYTGILFFPVLLSLFFLGLFILRRLIHRNITTDYYKDKFDTIRKYFQSYDPKLKEYDIFPPSEISNQKKRVEQWKKWYSPGTGGYVPIIVLLNSIILAFILIIIFTSSQISDNIINEDQDKNIKNNFTRTNVQIPTATNTTDIYDVIIQWLKNHYFYIAITLILIFTLIVYYSQYTHVMRLYKKVKLNKSNHEEELSFIVLSEKPEITFNKIKSGITLNKYKLKDTKKQLQITDIYFDLPDGSLQANKISLRVRIETNEKDKQKLITLKGPTKSNNFGNPIRLEIEKEWNFNNVINILLELTKLIQHLTINFDQINFTSDHKATLKNIGFNVIQERKTIREEIRVFVDDKVRDKEEFAKLYLDHVIFFLKLDLQIKYNNIEIELNNNNFESDQSTNLIQNQYSNYLLDFKHKFLLHFPEIKEWHHSKYLTGKAMKVLNETDKIQDIIDEQGYLKNSAYIRIDNLISEKKL
jgi:adenylate cyclase class IV